MGVYVKFDAGGAGRDSSLDGGRLRAIFECMTALDVCYRYGMPPNEREVGAINAVREVYGIRRIGFDEHNRTVTVEYDASRLSEPAVASLLRGAGLDIKEKIALV